MSLPPTPLLLGCIADDFTGATDLASMLVRQGMTTVQLIGVPGPEVDPGAAQAIVVALKSRTIASEDAVRQSLAALAWLRARGAPQILFKYCSTFDSTDRGNIGPVSEALLDALGADITIACPALPENGRSVYLGHLFVGEQLLSDSHMRHHPLTPMTDSNLVRVLGRQSRTPVGLLPYAVVDQGPDAIRAGLAALRAKGIRQVIADAVSERHLIELGAGAAELALITGGSGIAMGLPANFRRQGRLDQSEPADALPHVAGGSAILSGSCSAATLAQVERHRAAGRPALTLDPLRLTEGGGAEVERALAFAERHLGQDPVLFSSSAPPEAVAKVQARLGRERASAVVEDAMAAIAKGLVARGVRRLVVAGGETSGAVVDALGVEALKIGRPIDPGVP
ncbi:MAG TPA: 3-oxo-tetronate kinase, partial [Geminicoccaceae bacterium]|nr:3-oxo-tetronate kinase [Geminicoccaceae bacterium]